MNGDHRQGRQADGHLNDGQCAERIPDPVHEPRIHHAAQGDPQDKGGEDHAEGVDRRADQQGEGAGPGDLVDQGGKARHAVPDEQEHHVIRAVGNPSRDRRGHGGRRRLSLFLLCLPGGFRFPSALSEGLPPPAAPAPKRR